jgi:hypothetical protein
MRPRRQARADGQGSAPIQKGIGSRALTGVPGVRRCLVIWLMNHT